MFKNLALAIILAGVVHSSPTFAHAKLVSSSPAMDAKIQVAPKTLTLSFSEEVKLAAVTVTLEGKSIPVALDKTVPSAKTVVAPVSVIEPGRYEVKWTAISTDDGHVTRGSFVFTLSSAS